MTQEERSVMRDLVARVRVAEQRAEDAVREASFLRRKQEGVQSVSKTSLRERVAELEEALAAKQIALNFAIERQKVLRAKLGRLS